MLLLRKNQPNRLIVTLKEIALPTLPSNWLFVFTLEQALGQSNQTYKVYLPDLSTSEQFQMFYLDEGTDVTFEKTGDYNYQVFQMPDGGSMNETLGNKVEDGKMRLLKEGEPKHIFSSESNVFIL